jgi:hypothetical protein
MTNQVCGDNAQHIIEGASPIVLLKGTEGSAAIIGIRENAGKIEFGTCTVSGTYPNYTITWVATIHSIQVTGNILVNVHLPPLDNDGDKSALTSVFDRTVFVVPTGQAYTITKATLTPDIDLGAASHYLTLTLYNRGTDGNGTTAMAALAFSSAVANNVPTSMGAITSGAITAGQSISIAKTYTGNGLAWPGGLLQLEMTRTA